MILRIPVGNISNDDTRKQAIASLADEILATGQKKWGANAYFENLGEQNQITDDDKGVSLKWISRGIRIRDGVFCGVNVDIQWNREKKEVVEINVYEKTAFEDRMYAASFVLSGLISVLLIFSSSGLQRGSLKIVVCIVFVMVLLSMWLMIWLMRMLIKPNSRALRETAEEMLRSQFSIAEYSTKS
jgi:hypothetical protein